MTMNFGSICHMLWFNKNITFISRRFLSLKNVIFEPLKHRCVLRLIGPDSNMFLQGMITNDMRAFKNQSNTIRDRIVCLYAMLLNPRGRVMYDCIVYRVDDDEYLVEYDTAAVGFMKTHFDVYKLKKNVKIEHIKDMSVWAAYSWLETNAESDKVTLCDNVSWLKDTKEVISAADPRLNELGFRFIVPKDSDTEKHLHQNYTCRNLQNVSYSILRYKLGVGEGVNDYPPGNCLPFETNIDILNGVSFDKGCYIGQETVAKVHFTGVIRTRLMPVNLLPVQESYPKFEAECKVVNDKGQRIGKFRNNIGKYGLAALNVIEAMKCQTLALKGYDYQIMPVKPDWWPPYATGVNN